MDDEGVFFNVAEFGEKCSYTAYGSDAEIITIIDDTENRSLQSPAPPPDIAYILVKSSDVATPDYRDTINWRGSTWYVIENVMGGNLTDEIWTLKITKSARRQF